jgi:hypothetical protein
MLLLFIKISNTSFQRFIFSTNKNTVFKKYVLLILIQDLLPYVTSERDSSSKVFVLTVGIKMYFQLTEKSNQVKIEIFEIIWESILKLRYFYKEKVSKPYAV